MSWNDVLFGVVPYAVVAVAVVVTIARWRSHPFTVSSLSSQLLESRKLYWGSISFHWGLSLILVGHLLALLVPRGFELWNGAAVRLYLLEITGLGLALWAAFGITVLIARRVTNARVRRVTSPMDMAVLAIIAVQIATGIGIAIAYRWGSFWGTSVMVPYVRSLLRLQPDPSYVAALPWLIKAHVLAFFAFIAVFPFSRLVHIITLPLQYLRRPWQKVIAVRPGPGHRYAASDVSWRTVADDRANLGPDAQIARDALFAIRASGSRMNRNQLSDLLHTSHFAMDQIMATLVAGGFVAVGPSPDRCYELLVDLDDVAVFEIAAAVEKGRVGERAGIAVR